MVSYFYAWTPVVIVVGTVVLLTNVFLALIALMLVSLAALAAVLWAMVAVPYLLGRAISRRWQDRKGASPRTAAALSPANSGRRTRSVPAAAMAETTPQVAAVESEIVVTP
jgi:hypothetical protein